MGTEAIAKVYGETHNYFAELVDLCNDRDKLLICSTNLSQEQLFGGVVDEPDDPARPDGPTHRVVYPQRYDQRILSRLTGNTVRVWFEGDDLRMTKNNKTIQLCYTLERQQAESWKSVLQELMSVCYTEPSAVPPLWSVVNYIK